MAEVKAPLLRARLAETDGQDTAHTLLAELEAAQTQLPPDQIALLLPQFAWTRLQLVITNRRTKIAASFAASRAEISLSELAVVFHREPAVVQPK